MSHLSVIPIYFDRAEQNRDEATYVILREGKNKPDICLTAWAKKKYKATSFMKFINM